MLALYRSNRQADAWQRSNGHEPCSQKSSVPIRLAISNSCMSGSFARTPSSI